METSTEFKPAASKNTPDTWVCNFGKYKGSTYKSIALTDPSYGRWLVTVLRSEAAKNYMLSLL